MGVQLTQHGMCVHLHSPALVHHNFSAASAWGGVGLEEAPHDGSDGLCQ
jgi:hypothetical protein